MSPTNSPPAPGKSPSETSVCVIGAGIVGVNCALELVKQGFRVTIVDRDAPGEGCSFGNAGILAAWSFVPIFGPEVLRSLPRYLLDPMGPLTIRWTRLPQILPWLLRMLPKATDAHIRHAAGAMHHLTQGCAEAYRQLAADAGAPELVTQDRSLQVYDDEKDFLKADKDIAFRETFGARIERLGEADLRDLEPALAPRFRWAHGFLAGGRTLNPGRLTKVLAADFQRRGGKVLQATVTGIRRFDGAFMVSTDGEEVTASRLVIAAGAFSHKLSAMLGEYFPLGAERGYHAVVAEPGIQVNHAVNWKTRAFYASPMEMGLRLAGTVELAGLEAPPNWRRARMMRGLAQEMLPGLTGEITSEWMGFRPTLPDSLPVIGPSANVPGLFYAFGHQHVGLTCGPATARLVAGLMKGETPNTDISAFRPDRF